MTDRIRYKVRGERDDTGRRVWVVEARRGRERQELNRYYRISDAYNEIKWRSSNPLSAWTGVR